MILLYTDFGYSDPYIGQMHRVFAQSNAGVPVIDLFHNAPAFNVKASSYLLPAYCPPIKGSVYCCVVDPGVGSDRAALAIELDDCWYVGPDNGLFEILLRRYSAHTVNILEITERPADLSSSFHGRDLFAPVAAQLASGMEFDSRSTEIRELAEWPDELDEIVYVDHFGNLISGRRGDTLTNELKVEIGGRTIGHARTFSDLAVGELFWYRNANGLLEVAANQGNAADHLRVGVGDPITIKN